MLSVCLSVRPIPPRMERNLEICVEAPAAAAVEAPAAAAAGFRRRRLLLGVPSPESRYFSGSVDVPGRLLLGVPSPESRYFLCSYVEASVFFFGHSGVKKKRTN